jgi:hypothetical protein
MPTRLVPELSPLTAPTEVPVLTSEPVLAIPLVRPPQAAMARSANTGGDRQPHLQTNGGSRTASLSHQYGRLAL